MYRFFLRPVLTLCSLAIWAAAIGLVEAQPVVSQGGPLSGNTSVTEMQSKGLVGITGDSVVIGPTDSALAAMVEESSSQGALQVGGHIQLLDDQSVIFDPETQRLIIFGPSDTAISQEGRECRSATVCDDGTQIPCEWWDELQACFCPDCDDDEETEPDPEDTEDSGSDGSGEEDGPVDGGEGSNPELR